MRIRSIRPEFWTSEDIAKHDWETRLIFVGLWSYVDDNGVGRDVEKLIMADLLPLEDDPTEALMQITRALMHLDTGGQICRYMVEGKPYLHICKWSKHQVISRPSKGRYTALTCDDAAESPNAHAKDMSPHVNAPLGEGEKGRRGEGEKGRSNSADAEFDTDDFDAFWDLYDKKHGRKEAIAKYRIALKKRGVTNSLLIMAAGKYIEWQRAEGKHPEYTKNAATWLNGEHWNDERSAPARKLSTTDQRIADGAALTQRYLDQEEAEEQRLSIGQGR